MLERWRDLLVGARSATEQDTIRLDSSLNSGWRIQPAVRQGSHLRHGLDAAQTTEHQLLLCLYLRPEADSGHSDGKWVASPARLSKRKNSRTRRHTYCVSRLSDIAVVATTSKLVKGL